MNPDPLLETLLRAARRAAPADAAPPAFFERRIMARLRRAPGPDVWSLWAGGLWRAAASGLAVLLLAGLWSIRPAAQAADFDDLLDSALVAALAEPGDEL